jgi:hypothetical protein
MNLSFDLSVALGQLQRGEHRSFIAAERLSEAGEQCGLCRMQPCRPSARRVPGSCARTREQHRRTLRFLDNGN